MHIHTYMYVHQDIYFGGKKVLLVKWKIVILQ